MKRTIVLAYNEYFSSGFTTFSDQSSANNRNSYILKSRPYELLEMNDTVYRIEEAKYNVFEVVNWFLSREKMNHRKLQKLCYYAQAWFYALKNIRLMDTDFEAWENGPMSQVIYDKFESLGCGNIKLVGKYVSHIDKMDEELLESVWETYGDHTGNALEALSNSEQPWLEARIGYDLDEHSNVKISVETMKKYYASIYSGDDK